jgi:L-seryl-tRNA(Ser) seleniumtransferase
VTDNPYRDLPSVDALADRMTPDLPRRLLVASARLALDQARVGIANGEAANPDEIAGRIGAVLRRGAGVPVINAAGVLLHTNLGRASWSTAALSRAGEAALSYTNLEIDVSTGGRGRRGEYVESLLRELTGCESALVVNNNAAALLLALAATARGRSVPVARGELIEIGGAYRLPDVMEASGAHLVEIGTTNKTRVGDYLTALQTHNCGAILKIHPSNYRVDGFTEEATVTDLAGVATEDTPLLYDLGSGLLDADFPWLPVWLRGEPAARQALEHGAGLVMFSGDKLLGGPQAGILVGEGSLVAELRANPLARALRVDGVTYAALAATLETYLDDGPPESIPFWRHALADVAVLEDRSHLLAKRVDGVVEAGSSAVGAGSAPGISISSPLVRIVSGQALFERLLQCDPAILTRRDAGDLVLDLRAVEPVDDERLAEAIVACR